MKRLIKILLHLFSPGTGWVFLLIPVSMASLLYALIVSNRTSVFNIISYLLSAYTLTAFVLRFPKIVADVKSFFRKSQRISNVKSFLCRNKYIKLYFTNIPFRVKVSLYVSLFINLTYAALKMISGIHYSSFWFGAEAIFYLVLGSVRFIILRNMRKDGDLMHEYRVFRFCGYLLFALNVALTGIVYQMIYQAKGKEYPGFMIYIVAAYTFIFLIISITHLIKYRKLNKPIISAVKVINLTTALVAVYSLQIAMFASFGDDKNMELIMNSIFGGLLCISIFGMAVFMVVRGFEKHRSRNGKRNV